MSHQVARLRAEFIVSESGVPGQRRKTGRTVMPEKACQVIRVICVAISCSRISMIAFERSTSTALEGSVRVNASALPPMPALDV